MRRGGGWSRVRGVLFAAAVLVGEARAAHAGGNADEAELHFQLGAEAYQRKEFRSALEHFLASNRLVPNRNVVFNVARTFEQLGRYAEAYRYFTDAREGETDPGTLRELDAARASLAPKVALVRVETTPPGASVFLDRADLGSLGAAPRTLALAPGRYRVIVSLEGFESPQPVEVEAVLGKQADVRVALTRIEGTVRVDVEGTTRPEVRVDDEAAARACVAPCELRLPPGPHVLYFAAEGFQAAPRQVVVRARETVRAVARLSELRGTVVVEADEPGAAVEIDGKAMGFTPAVVRDVAVGKRRVTVRARGYQPLTREIEVRPNRQVDLVGLKLVPLREVQAVSRVAEDADLAASSVSVIPAEELRAFGYPTVAAALRGVRGVYLSNDYGYESAGLRGIGEPNDYGNRVLVLQDGLRMNDNLLSSSYIGTDLRPDLYTVERIEVVRGPGSLLYGTGAFSGVVNVVPRSTKEPTQAFAGVGAFGNGVGRAMGGFHYNLNDRVGAWATVGATRSDGVDLPIRAVDASGDATDVVAPGIDRTRSFGTEGRAWAGPFTAQWRYNQRTQTVPTGAFRTVVGDPRTYYRDERIAGELRYEPSFERVDLYARAHVNHYRFDGVYAFAAPTASVSERYLGTWFGAEARARIRLLDWLRVTVGGEGQLHPVAELGGTELDASFTPRTGGSYLAEARPYRFAAGYALVDAEPTAWFRGEAGVRVDVYSGIGPIVVPRGALVFRPSRGGVLKVMGGRAFRAPSVYEQFYNDGGVTQVAAVDSARGLALGPESITSGEVEYLHRFLEDWVALGSVHASHIDDIINTVSDADPRCASEDGACLRYANAASPALTAGADVELRREWRRGWALSAFYGYQRAQFLAADDPALAANPRLLNAPEHLAGFRGVVPLADEVARLALRGALEGPRRLSLASDAVTSPVVVLDATLSGFARKFGVRYAFGVYNLLDSRYDLPVADTFASRSLVQPRRTVLLDVSVAYP